MAKVKINWPPMSMKAEGEDAAVLAQAEQFLKCVKEAHKISFDVLPTLFRDGCRDPEEGVGEPECVGCNDDCESCEDVRMECWSDQLMELGLFAGEKKAYCAVDATEGEYLPYRGGNWNFGGSAGLFYLNLYYSRADSYWDIGGRSAYFKKR